MTSDILHNFVGSQTASKGFFRFWKGDERPPQVTELLRSAYTRLKKAEAEIEAQSKRIIELEGLLTIDEITGLANRRGFDQAFEAEMDRVNRGQNKGGLLIMIDLDYFKDINDTHGHMAGDKALRAVGDFLRANIRPMDCAARFGGDEFVIMMANTSAQKAMERAKKLGRDLNALRFGWKGKMITLHGSLGLQEFHAGDTPAEIIESADHGMYADKAARKKAAS